MVFVEAEQRAAVTPLVGEVQACKVQRFQLLGKDLDNDETAGAEPAGIGLKGEEGLAP
jgi:hypothetical protein